MKRFTAPDRLRLFPLLAITAALLLALKGTGVLLGISDSVVAVGGAAAQTEESEGPAVRDEWGAAGDADAATAPDENLPEEEAAAASETEAAENGAASEAEEATADRATPDETAAAEGGGLLDERPAEVLQASAPGEPPITEPMEDGTEFALLTEGEVEVLQSLADRRAELDRRADALDLKAKTLAAVESRLAERVNELRALEARLEALFVREEEAAEQELAGLVTTYENMKPKDAARIFETLDMDVLISVISRMNERKVSPVLAAMDPLVAQEITVELATRHRSAESMRAPQGQAGGLGG